MNPFLDTLPLLSKTIPDTCSEYVKRLEYQYRSGKLIVYSYFLGNHGDWEIYFVPRHMKEQLDVDLKQDFYKFKSSLIVIDEARQEERELDLEPEIVEHELAQLGSNWICLIQIYTAVEDTYGYSGKIHKGERFINSSHEIQYLPVDYSAEEYYRKL